MRERQSPRLLAPARQGSCSFLNGGTPRAVRGCLMRLLACARSRKEFNHNTEQRSLYTPCN